MILNQHIDDHVRFYSIFFSIKLLFFFFIAVTNPVKKIFIGQLPTEFVEQDLSDYFSQFGIIDTIELVNKNKVFFFFLKDFLFLANGS